MSRDNAPNDGTNTTSHERGFKAFLGAVESGASYYLKCPKNHGWLPPRRICPVCGSRELTQTPLPESGTLCTHTVVAVPTPRFVEDAPYATGIAAFGPVHITGVIRGINPDDIETGLEVGLGVEETATTGDPVLVFRPG